MFNWFKRFGKQDTNPGRGIYGYPNDGAANLDKALHDIWMIYIQNPKSGIDIDVQGMGASVEQYHVKTCVMRDGKVFWKKTPVSTGCEDEILLFASPHDFIRLFPHWVEQRIKRFSDNNDYCLAFYSCR